MRWDTKLVTLWDESECFLKKVSLFLADVWCWHFNLNSSLRMILGAQKTRDQALFNKPKYTRNGLWSSELRLAQYHKVTVFFKSEKNIKIDKMYRNPYCKKWHFLKKTFAEGNQFGVPSHMCRRRWYATFLWCLQLQLRFRANADCQACIGNGSRGQVPSISNHRITLWHFADPTSHNAYVSHAPRHS